MPYSQKIYKQILSDGEVSFKINESNRIYLRVFPPRPVPLDVRVHHVPVFRNPDFAEMIEYEDLTAQEIIDRIDGVSHVKKLCGQKFSPLLACRTVRDLCYAGICRLDNIFKYSNRYRTTSKLTVSVFF